MKHQNKKRQNKSKQSISQLWGNFKPPDVLITVMDVIAGAEKNNKDYYMYEPYC